MGRLSLIAVLALAGCSFHPVIPGGTVSCQITADCPSGLTCQPPAAPDGPRLCCGPQGCPAIPRGADAAADRPDEVPARGPSDAAPPPDDAGEEADALVARPDTAPADAAAVDVATLVTCSPSVSGPLPSVNGRRSYCSLGLLDDKVVLDVDTIDGQDPTTIATVRSCQAPLALGAALSGQDLETLIALIGHYQGLCRQLSVNEVVGAYATGWARQAPGVEGIKTAVQGRTGLALDIPTPDQELLQRYLGTSRNRRGRLVVHARGGDFVASFWPAGNAAPTELTIAARLSAADAIFSSPRVTTYQDGRRQYGEALRTELDDPIRTWEQMMNSGRLDRSLTGDTDDATLVLAVGETLRNDDDVWDAVATWKTKVAAAALVTEAPYGRSYGVLDFRDLSRFVNSIDTPQFEQLRREPIHSAYGLQVMGLGAFFEVLNRDLPVNETGLVPSGPSHGYLFRKRFSPQ